MKSLSLVVLLVFLLSCSTINPIAESKYNSDRERSLNSYRIAHNQLHQNSNKESVIDLAISRRLTSMGYTQNDKPSFFIYYQIIESPKKIKRFLNRNSETLIITFYDPIRQEEIWKGSLPGIDSKTPRNLLFAVNSVMDDFDILSQKMIARNLY